jgi:muramoyltetrapeptide carboxypeptidase
MISLLENEGLKVRLYPNTFAKTDYLAGSDRDRANDLMTAFTDDSKAVICSRGGYGCSRLVPYLDREQMAKSQKLLYGFSDITVLHAMLSNRGMPSIHSPMALTLNTPREDWVYQSFRASLYGHDPIPGNIPASKCVVEGECEGFVVGGCLILLADLIGTPDELDMNDKVVVIEGVDDPPHRVDAMLTHLINSGSLQKAKGIIVGEMTRTDLPEKADQGIGSRPWKDIVIERLAPLGIPLIIDFPFGHARNMVTLPLGVRAHLDAESGKLTYLESPCQA